MSKPAAPKFIFVTLLLDIIGIGIVIPVLPELVAQLLGGNESEAARYYGPLVSLYAVMQVLFAPLLGALSDRFGRRPVLLISLAGMGISYLILGFAPTLGWLYVGRALAGITGATITTANAYMADISTAETRAANFGLIGAAFGVGFVLGPATGGILGEIGPRVPFFASAGVVFLNAMWGLWVLPESLPPERRRPISRAELIPLSGLRSLRISPLVTGLAVVSLLSALGQRGLESVWVLHAGLRYGWGELENGLSLTVVGLSAAIVQGGLVRRIVPRLGEPRAVQLGLLLGAVSMLLYGLADQGWMIFLIVPIGSLGAISGPALMGLVTGAVDPQHQGAVQGALASLQSVGTVAAPLLTTTLFAIATDGTLPKPLPGLPFFACSGAVLLAWGAAWLTLRSLPPAPPSEASVPPGEAEAPVG
ncbi:MAG TPA: MFS transporter [Deltaproteobacteria bacterium]|nr:MFS transporter [Deltaproteobacteria bacterium]